VVVLVLGGVVGVTVGVGVFGGVVVVFVVLVLGGSD